MFKHILLPHDGSAISSKAIRRGIDFARKIKARVTAIHIVPQFMVAADVSLVPLSPGLRKRLEDQARARAQKILGAIVSQAKRRGVRCSTMSVVSDFPYQQIIASARKKKCDLIMMASHGRRGLSSLLLGSETAKVLMHSKVPVLVVR